MEQLIKYEELNTDDKSAIGEKFRHYQRIHQDVDESILIAFVAHELGYVDYMTVCKVLRELKLYE